MEDRLEASTAGDARSAVGGLASADPTAIATTFLSLVLSGPAATDAALRLVTPESAHAWGEFAAVRGRLEEIGNWGLGTYPVSEENTRDVAYVQILSELTSAFQRRTESVVSVAALITLVWRPEAQSWLVHAFGGYLPPARVPRTSLDVAPAYSRGTH